MRKALQTEQGKSEMAETIDAQAKKIADLERREAEWRAKCEAIETREAERRAREETKHAEEDGVPEPCQQAAQAAARQVPTGAARRGEEVGEIQSKTARTSIDVGGILNCIFTIRDGFDRSSLAIPFVSSLLSLTW